jgi:PhnB protein
MKIVTYLNFAGQCEAAFRFYERVLNGRIEALLRHDVPEMADHVPPEWRDKVMHACLFVGDAMLMGSDAPPEQYTKPAGLQVSLHIDEVKEAERVFNALADNGQVTMPLAQTFWASRFGMLVDQFGIPWMINCSEQTCVNADR